MKRNFGIFICLCYIVMLFGCNEDYENGKGIEYLTAERKHLFLSSQHTGFQESTGVLYDYVMDFNYVGETMDVSIETSTEPLEWDLSIMNPYNTDDTEGKVEILRQNNGFSVKLIEPLTQNRVTLLLTISNPVFKQYEINVSHSDIPFLENLSYNDQLSQLGYFRSYTIAGNGAWRIENSSVRAGGVDGDYYLVSPPLSLKNIKEAYISYEYMDMENAGEKQEVLICTDYVGGDPSKATWSLLNDSHGLCSTSDEFRTKAVNVPANYMGMIVYVAFRYKAESTTVNYPVWAIKNFSIAQGNVDTNSDTSVAATVSEVLNGVDGQIYRVSGVVTRIENTKYGNFYIKDNFTSEELYIYGLKDDAGNYSWESFDVEVGDFIVVEGARSTYNATPQLKNARFISRIKATNRVAYTVNGVSFNMVKVEGGTFTMGSDDSDAESCERPVHQVTITKDFYIGETEVTQELWYAVMDSEPTSGSSHGLGNKDPAYDISWNDCQEFITKLNGLIESANFMLPSEAQWEYAARGGNKSKGYTYSGSNTIDEVAWYYSNSGSVAHAVATKSPNELGIYDMSGNVWEWCQDWSGDYSSAAVTDPEGPTTGTDRVLRGGCWLFNRAFTCRVSYRYCNTPIHSSPNIGMRLALSSSR